MIKLSIFTHYVPSYRKYLFDNIGKKYQLSIYADDSFSDFKLIKESSNFFSFINSPVKQIGILNKKLYFQKNFIKSFKESEIIIISALKSDISVWIMLLMSIFISKKIIIWGHLKPKNSIEKMLFSLMISLSSKAIVYTDYDLIAWSDSKLNRKIYSVNNSMKVDVVPYDYNKLIATYPEIKRIKDNNHCFIFSARISKNKKFHLILDALSKEILKNSNILILVIGEGEEYYSVIKEVKRNNLESSFIFFGRSYDKELLSFCYQNSISSLIPSHAGLSIIQSIAHSVPVITSNNRYDHPPEFSYLRHLHNSLLYKSNDALDLAKKIYMLIDDKKLQNEMKINAHKDFNINYSPTNMTKNFLNIIDG